MASKTWALKLTPTDAPQTVATGLSENETRSALNALVSGDHRTHDAILDRVAEREGALDIAA